MAPDIDKSFRDLYLKGTGETFQAAFINIAFPLKPSRAYQYLVSEETATVVSNAVAVALTLTLPRLYVLLKRSIPHILASCRRLGELNLPFRHCRAIWLGRSRVAVGVRTTVSTLDSRSIEMGSETQHEEWEAERRITVGILATLQDSLTPEDAVARLARRHLAMRRLTVGLNGRTPTRFRQMLSNLADDPKAFASILACMLLFFVIFAELQVIAISSNFIVGGSAASIREGACEKKITGWDNNWDTKPALYRPSLYGDSQESALRYAEACYSAHSPANQCHSFLTRTIPHNVTSGTVCPFTARDVCKQGNSSGFTLDTGFLDASILGVNTDSPFEFRRRTTCAPVVDNGTYVHIIHIDQDYVRIQYRYGSLFFQETKRRSPSLHSPGQTYDVKLWARPNALFRGRLASKLHPNFDSNTSATTLLFIDNQDIQYAAYSDDAIFPARTLHPDSSQTHKRWLYLGLSRKVLGCSDERYIRDRRSGLEWYQLDALLHDRHSDHWWNVTSPTLKGSKELPYGHKSLTALRLLGLALMESDSASAVGFLRFQWLDAASRIVRGLSLPLDSHQWQLESHKLFNISLARMQFVIVNMAQGLPGGEIPLLEGVFDLLDGSLVDPCGMLRIYAVGMKNLSLSGLAGMLGMALGIWFLTIETEDSIMLMWLFRGLAKPAVRGVWVGVCYIWGTATALLWSF